MPVGTGVMYTGSGNLNQWLFVVPEHDLVVVFTGGANQAMIPDVMYRDVLAAVIRDQGALQNWIREVSRGTGGGQEDFNTERAAVTEATRVSAGRALRVEMSFFSREIRLKTGPTVLSADVSP